MTRPDRERMVKDQIARRGVRDPRVLAAMRLVPREAFVAPELAHLAYEDSALAIEEGQTISQPLIVAMMIEAAAIGPEDVVLDVGAGSGYAAAVCSRIARRVLAIERIASLAQAARERWDALGYANIELRVGDGSLGWPEAAPFDAILVAAAAPSAPKALTDQLALCGRLVIPVGDADCQQLMKITRGPDGLIQKELGLVRFVPLIGAQGWSGG